MNVAHCMENEIQALIFHPCLSLCHLFQMHNESFGWNVEAKPAMLNPLRFPPWWQTLIRDRPTSIILEKCFWDKYIYIYIYIYKYHLPFRCRDIFLWAVDHGRSGWKKRLVVMISGRSAPQCRKVRVDRNGIQRKWVKAPSVYFSLQQGKLMQSPTKLQTHF